MAIAMLTMKCTLSYLTPDLQERTLFHHTARGVARYITTPASVVRDTHPLDFAFLLGLGPMVDWWPRAGVPALKVDEGSKRFLLMSAAHHWQKQLADFDVRTLARVLARIPEQLRPACCNLIHLHIKGHDMKVIPETSKLPKEVHDRLLMNLASLEQSLLSKDPLMAQHLRNSHAILVSYPETVHLLDDQEVARLIDAAEIHTKTEIVKAVAAGKGASSKKKLDVSDL